MSHTTKVISVGAINVEAGSGYFATLDMSFLQPENTISRVNRDTDAPVVTNVALGLHSYGLKVLVLDALPDDVDARRRAILHEFDSTRGPVTVVIENATGTPRRRFMSFVARKVDQVAEQMGHGFYATLEAADEARWRATAEVEVVWELNESGTRSLTVDGDLDTYPVYTLTPNSNKAAPNWPYRRLILVEWRSPLGGAHPIDVTGGGIDTAALLAAGKITDGSSITVMMNGVIRRHFYPDNTADPSAAFGTTQTKIWIDMEFRPAVYPVLAGYIFSTSTTWPVRDDYGLPPSGTLKVDDELVTYTSRAPGYLYGVARGQIGTTAAAHEAGASITHYQGVGWLLYGPEAVVPEGMKNDAYRAAQPPIVITGSGGSSNTVWCYQKFAQPPRAASWIHTSFLNNLGFVSESNNSTGVFDPAWVYPWDALGLRAGWTSLDMFSLRVAVPVKSVRVQGRHIRIGSPSLSPSVPSLSVWSEDRKSGRPLWSVPSLPFPGNNDPFDVSSADVAVFDPEFEVGYNRIYWSVSQTAHMQADIRTMWVRFDDRLAPAVTLTAEDTEYDLDLTLGNATTGESITVQFPNLAPAASLIIDSQWQTVTYTLDGSNQYPAVRRDAARPKFLRLAPGVNEFHISEAGMGDLEIRIAYRARWYA